MLYLCKAPNSNGNPEIDRLSASVIGHLFLLQLVKCKLYICVCLGYDIRLSMKLNLIVFYNIINGEWWITRKWIAADFFYFWLMLFMWQLQVTSYKNQVLVVRHTAHICICAYKHYIRVRSTNLIASSIIVLCRDVTILFVSPHGQSTNWGLFCRSCSHFLYFLFLSTSGLWK